MRNRLPAAFAVLFACLALSSCATSQASQPASRSETTLIAGADVLTMVNDGLDTAQTVVIEGDRIAAVRDFRQADLSVPGAIDARGKFVMPGLVDMHIHFAKSPGEPGDAAQRAAAVMLAHGVTTARSMAGAPEHVVLRDALESGAIAGPRIYIASPAISDGTVKTASEAEAAVRDAKAAGFDLVKSHFISDPAIWEATGREAKRLGLATAGHVANSVGLERAIPAGQQIEHLDGFAHALLPSEAPERSVEFGQIPPPPILAKIDLGTLAQNAVFDLAAHEPAWQVPTLGLFELLMDTGLTIEELKARPEMRYVPPEAVEQWAAQRQQLQTQLTPEFGAVVTEFRREVVRALDAKGVPLMAGSDAAQAFHVWGPALHREIASLSRIIGIDKALRSATVVPRDYFRSLPANGSSLGWAADFGTIAQGARADILILDADPRANLSALDRPQAVIRAGEVFDRGELDRLLANASDAAKGVKPSAASATNLAAPVWVMRHLEAEDSGERNLTAAGKQQAQELASYLAKEGVAAIYVTDTLRARRTAEPLAEALGLEPIVYDPFDGAALVEQIRIEGRAALVVGHSNTAPEIARALGAEGTQADSLVNFGTVFAAHPSGPAIHRLGAARIPATLATPCSQAGLPPETQCGRIMVLENRSKPEGRKIPVGFAILPATRSSTQDPLVIIPGGPGLGGMQAGAGVAQLFAAYRADRDLVLIDQRGTGSSNRLACEEGVNAATLLSALQPMDGEAVENCRDALMQRADLTQYHTRESVLDMQAVRKALGYDRFDLFGMSYGTRPALDYLRLYPEHVGETVIRAAAPVGMKLPLYTPRDAQAVYDLLVETCRQQADCAARHPDLHGDLDKMMNHFADGPVEISVVDPRNGERLETELTRDALRSVLFFMLYIPEFTTQLPPLIE